MTKGNIWLCVVSGIYWKDNKKVLEKKIKSCILEETFKITTHIVFDGEKPIYDALEKKIFHEAIFSKKERGKILWIKYIKLEDTGKKTAYDIYKDGLNDFKYNVKLNYVKNKIDG